MQKKRQSEATQKRRSTKWGIKLFQGMFGDFRIDLKSNYKIREN